KNRTKRDLAMIKSEVRATAAATYTTNLVKGAPLTVTKNHIADGYAQEISKVRLMVLGFLGREMIHCVCLCVTR
ncbi:MAG: bifunctional ornithine acetyltransferase/N-acetylglutamate synthase, partial [Flavobacteriales bacterium]|nr:bifunctional ornithine acetyltransferase/N-acetylglutamate synthase [Flavobacteriales bacterium]